jgi:uncharacterized membrane protein
MQKQQRATSKGKTLHNMIREAQTPLVGGLFFALVAVLASSLGYWGMEGIFFAVLLSAVVVIGGKMVLSAFARSWRAMIHGRPNRLDYLTAPSGYRRKRYAESREEYAAQTVVIPTPNRPILPEEPAPVVVEATPDVSTSRAVMPQRLANKQQFRPTRLELALDFNPEIAQVIGRALLCLGIRGSGKSNFAALFIEQMCKLFLPAIIFDYLIDFDTLPQVLPHCRIGGHPAWKNRGSYGANFCEVDIDNAEDIGYELRENGGQLVIELPSYPDNEYASQVVQGILSGMIEWAEERAPAKRYPALVVLDEAQQLLPQNLQDAENKETTQALLRTFKRLNEVGRHFGLTPAIFTQRAARINKDVIGGTEIHVIMKQNMPQDMKAIEDIVGKENINRQEIASFEKGDALVYEGGESFHIHFDLRQSEHKSSMPELDETLSFYQNRHSQNVMTRRLEDPGATRKLAADETEPPAPVKTPAPKQKSDMEKVLDALQENPFFTYREISEKVNFGKDKVGELIKEAKERGFLEERESK